MEEKRKNTDKLKIVIIILSLLLAISIIALAVKLINNQISSKGTSSDVITDNIITPEEDTPSRASASSLLDTISLNEKTHVEKITLGSEDLLVCFVYTDSEKA